MQLEDTLKTIMVFGWAVVGAVYGLAQAPDLQKKVDLDVVAAPAPVALKELAKAAGYPFTVGRGLEDFVLSLHVKQGTVSDTMDRIAEACRAEWRKEADAYRLVVGSELAKKQNSEEVQLRVNGLKAAIQSQAKRDGGLVGILADVPIHNLAAMGANSRLVFSTHPTRMQVALPRTAVQKILDFVKTSKTANDSSGQQTVSGGGARMVIRGAPQGPMSNNPPAKALLTVSRVAGTADANYMVQLLVVDAGGLPVANGATFLTMGQSEQSAKAVPQLADDKPINLPAEAQEFINLMAAGPTTATSSTSIVSAEVRIAVGVGGQDSEPTVMTFGPETPSVKVPEAWLEKLLNPEKFEPHAFATGPALVAAAQARKENLVACLTDRALGALQALKQPQKATQILETATRRWGMTVETKDGWLVLGPERPVVARSEQVDRTVLGTVLKLATRQGYLNLDQQAAYVRQQPNGGHPGGLERRYASLLGVALPGNLEAEGFTCERSMLLYYASVGQGGLRNLLSGQPVPFQAINRGAQSLLSAMVFNSTDGPQVAVDGEMPLPMGILSRNLATERTEVLPLGIPNQGSVTVRTNERPIVFGIDPVSGSKQLVEPMMIGMARAGGGPAGFQIKRYERFVVGSQTTLTFTFHLLPNVTFSRTLRDSRPDPRSREMTYEQLPEPIRRLADQGSQIQIGVEPPVRLD